MSTSSSAGPARGARVPATYRAVVAVLAVALAAVTLSVIGDATRPAASAIPSGATVPTGGPTAPPATPGNWEALPANAFVPTTTLEPATVTPAGRVARETSFTLASLTGRPVSELLSRLSAVPPVTFALAPGATPAATSASIVPTTPLEAGREYRFTLRDASGGLTGSWLYRVVSAPVVVATSPWDEATNVPRTVGIELTFDQDGIGSVEPYLTITPAVAGHLEHRPRVWVFVPDAPLKAATVYTVELRAGVPLEGTDLTMAKPVRFAFETAGGLAFDPREPRLTDDLSVEVAPGTRAWLKVVLPDADDEEEGEAPAPTAIDLAIHRLPTVTAARAALATLQAGEPWAEISDAGLVPTADLERVASDRYPLRVAVEAMDGTDRIVELPGLAAGWYLVVHRSAGRDQQVVVQVTSLSAADIRSVRGSIVWVNDVVDRGPTPGAALWSASGARLGTADMSGLIRYDAIADGVLVVTRTGVAPDSQTAPGDALVLAQGAPPYPWLTDADAGPRDYRSVLATDRTRFRQTDTIDAWGVVRGRDGTADPTSVEVRVTARDEDGGEPGPAITRVRSTPDRSGAFAVAIPIAALPAGSYQLELWAAGDPVASRWFEVGEIRKPAYTITVTTDRHALLQGEALHLVVDSRFYDGTAVAGLPIELGGDDLEGRRVTTGADGTARLTVTTGAADPVWFDWRSVEIASELPEEAASVVLGGDYVVFPSRVVIRGEATSRGSTVVVTGRTSDLDLAAVERGWDHDGDAWDDAVGAPAPGTPLSVRIVERWQERTVVGTRYDYVTKRTVPVIEMTDRERLLPSRTSRSGSDGTFRLAIDGFLVDPSLGDHYVEVEVTARDDAGRGATADYSAPLGPDTPTEPIPRLELVSRPDDDHLRRVGDLERLTVTWAGATLATDPVARYLYLTLRDGIRESVVDASPTFQHRYVLADIPNLDFVAIRFDGTTYALASFGTFVARDPVTLDVGVSPSVARAAPGDRISLAITVKGPDRSPVAATVVVRAVDERLYGADLASPVESLQWLYDEESTGLRGTGLTHRTIVARLDGGGGYGSTTGGDGGEGRLRSDFKDEPLFELVRTDATGRASLALVAPDDITSWRISATAVGEDGRIGDGRADVAVGIPLFVEAPVAPEYLAGDRPTLVVRSYGSALTAGQRLTYTVSAPTLGMAPRTVTGVAFQPLAVELPVLATGDHPVRIDVRASTSSGPVADSLERTVHVIASRFTSTVGEHVVLPAALPAGSTDAMTTFVIADEGRGRYLAEVQELAREVAAGGRLDTIVAAAVARDLLSSTFGAPTGLDGDPADRLDAYLASIATDEDDDDEVRLAAFAVLPFSSPELELTARAALLAPDQVGRASVARFLGWILDRSRAGDETRERGVLALAGLAGLTLASDEEVRDVALDALGGDPAARVDEALDVALTPRERLVLAVAAARLGDGTSSRAILRPLLERYGERLGPWVRLAVPGDTDAVAEATWLAAIVAAEIGDPIGEAARAYVEENPATLIYPLEQAALVRASVAAAPSTPATFAYTLAGERRTVTLGPGEYRRFVLTPAQRAAFALEPIAGSVGVTGEWSSAVAPASLEVDPALSIVRTVTPASPIASGALVTVTLRTRIATSMTLEGCQPVTDLVPSGLRPFDWDPAVERGSHEVAPFAISGQRVSFCASKDPLVYYARVVTPGTYRWEPALLQLERAPDHVGLTPASTIRISAP